MPNLHFAKEKKDEFQNDKIVYKILIVDDDQSIHDITNLTLKAMVFKDFEIKVLTAFSAKEAKDILNKHPDIALALIDVVMETSEAGLDLVNYIRNDLKNNLIRLVIRTGQANEHPQMNVIDRYDINDFKEKTELTLERLYTTIRSSVRQYVQLVELQQKYEETYRQMTTNHLTKLPNRAKLYEDCIDQNHQTLILIDIIGFSSINESNGYDVGDYVLRELGGFLQTMYGEDFKVYHLDSDLFALIAPETKLSELVKTVEHIKDDISRLHIVTKNFNKSIDTTIGVAYEGETNLMRKAELALKEARSIGKNQIKYYSDDLKVIKRLNETNHWAPLIKESINNGNMLAYYQPIYNLKSDEIEKYELLVRIKNEDKVHSPIEFLDAAKQSGQLYDIFRFMFTKACEQAKSTGKKFSVNIGNSEFFNDGLLTFIKDKLVEYEIKPQSLSLEILENESINDGDIKGVIREIHDLGIEIIIDDFGIHCSNFGQIDSLPIDIIKIDGSFIKNLPESENSQVIIKTIKTFASAKNIKLVAEFVHNEEVLNMVKTFELEFAQGYYLGMPQESLVI